MLVCVCVHACEHGHTHVLMCTWTCTWHGVHVEVREQMEEVRSFFPTSLILDAGYQACQQAFYLPSHPTQLGFSLGWIFHFSTGLVLQRVPLSPSPGFPHVWLPYDLSVITAAGFRKTHARALSIFEKEFDVSQGGSNFVHSPGWSQTSDLPSSSSHALRLQPCDSTPRFLWASPVLGKYSTMGTHL